MKREISLLVDKEEFKLLNEIIIVDEEIENSISHAKLKGDKYKLKFSYDGLDELAGFLAAAANHEKSLRKQEILNNLCDKVEEILEING